MGPQIHSRHHGPVRPHLRAANGSAPLAPPRPELVPLPGYNVASVQFTERKCSTTAPRTPPNQTKPQLWLSQRFDWVVRPVGTVRLCRRSADVTQNISSSWCVLTYLPRAYPLNQLSTFYYLLLAATDQYRVKQDAVFPTPPDMSAPSYACRKAESRMFDSPVMPVPVSGKLS